MASSRDTSNGPDWQDILVLLEEMEAGLDCRVEVQLKQVKLKGVSKVGLKVTAHPQFQLSGVQRLSVSLSATLERSGCGLGCAVIYRTLLALDFEASKVWAVKQK